jgi:hypothetical protein
MLTTRQFVLGLMVACLVGAAVGTVSLGLPLLATQVFGFVVLVILLVSLVRLVRLLLVPPRRDSSTRASPSSRGFSCSDS